MAARGPHASGAAPPPRHLAPQRPSRRRFRLPGRRLQAHPLPLEEALRRPRPGRTSQPPEAGSAGLREAGYITGEEPTTPHPDKPREFERARPNQLWQTDIFTFILKRQNRRVYLVAFLEDQSRYIVRSALR